ncbi:MAG TPA: glycosyltransferase [Bacteroidetes bacterium]|nr:glycosyltransferase [Bacteroidota bacterium]
MLVPALLVLHACVLALALTNAVWMRSRRDRRRALAEPVRVSVLIPARNEEANLARLLPSLLAQDHPDLQIVVVDDASEDGTWEVLRRHADPRLVTVRGNGPPAGWVGKVHALYQAQKRADGDVLVFLDADTWLPDPGAIRSLVERFAANAPETAPGRALADAGIVMTGLPQYRDRFPTALLTSLVPFAVMAALPVPLVSRTRAASLGALNGQIWMMGAGDYRRIAPHEQLKDEVLEDVMIGRLAKREGLRLHFEDLRREVSVEMYGSLGEAWRGFQKNAFLLGGGGTWGGFAAFFALYTLVWVVAPLAALSLLATTWAIKAVIDRSQGLPLAVTATGPLPLFLGALLQLDSARVHATGRVRWKGRGVG